MRRQVCEGRYAKAGMRRQVCCYVCVRALLRQVCEGRYAKAGMLLCLCPRTTLYVSSCSHHIYVAAKLSRHDVETGRPVRGRPPSACRELDSWLTSSSSACDYNDDATRASSDSQFAHAEFRIVYLGRGVSPCHPGRSRSTLNPKPYTLHPTPYTLHPTPDTRNPTPETLQPSLSFSFSFFFFFFPHFFLYPAACATPHSSCRL